MRVAVIGGGWAGLSAAWTLHQLGHEAHVFEAGRVLGGRARSRLSARLGTTIDNGQHILLGAYGQTLGLMRELGLNPDHLFLRLPLRLCTPKHDFDFRLSSLPAPFHLLVGVLRSRGISWSDKWRLARVASAAQNTASVGPKITVAQWLNGLGQSERMRRMLWDPLCVAALNTRSEHASAQLFAAVLRDSVGRDARASDVLIPRVGLTQLWPSHLPSTITQHLGHTVRRLTVEPAGIRVDGLLLDAVIVATHVPSTLRLLQNLPEAGTSRTFLEGLKAFQYAPIATLNLALKQPWTLEQPMTMLNENTADGRYGQWLFNRAAFGEDPLSRHLVHIVVSDAEALQQLPRAVAIQALIKQIRDETDGRNPMPQIVNHELLIEKRATFSALPALPRPSNQTPWPRIWIAGDWTDTGYPGVLEGAIQSGIGAARALHDELV